MLPNELPELGPGGYVCVVVGSPIIIIPSSSKYSIAN